VNWVKGGHLNILGLGLEGKKQNFNF
jgi:hypothetical protein